MCHDHSHSSMARCVFYRNPRRESDFNLPYDLVEGPTNPPRKKNRERLFMEILNMENSAVLYRVTEGDVVRVDRMTNWGNPFVMEVHKFNRTWACQMFKGYALWRLRVQPDWLEPLRGRSLACWCAPRRCHAETLMRLANQERG